MIIFIKTTKEEVSYGKSYEYKQFTFRGKRMDED